MENQRSTPDTPQTDTPQTDSNGFLPGDYVELSDIANSLPGRPTRGMVWRWCLKGIQTKAGKVFLQFSRRGRRVMTTQKWVKEFMRTIEADSATQAVEITKRRGRGRPRKVRHAAANVALKSQGL